MEPADQGAGEGTGGTLGLQGESCVFVTSNETDRKLIGTAATPKLGAVEQVEPGPRPTGGEFGRRIP